MKPTRLYTETPNKRELPDERDSDRYNAWPSSLRYHRWIVLQSPVKTVWDLHRLVRLGIELGRSHQQHLPLVERGVVLVQAVDRVHELSESDVVTPSF